MKTIVALGIFSALIFIIYIISKMSGFARFMLFLVCLGIVAVWVFSAWYKGFTKE